MSDKPQAVPDGFVLVPREPTREMWASMAGANVKAHRDNQRSPTLAPDAVNEAVFKAAIEAAEKEQK